MPTASSNVRFQSDPLEAVNRVPQNLQQSLRLARYLHFPHDPARVIHNADAGLLDRYVQSSKMVHAALLLLMLEAVTTDLVSPSACSAAPKIFSYPQAGPADYPIFRGKTGSRGQTFNVTRLTHNRHPRG
jgi:hypothetical protein